MVEAVESNPRPEMFHSRLYMLIWFRVVRRKGMRNQQIGPDDSSPVRFSRFPWKTGNHEKPVKSTPHLLPRAAENGTAAFITQRVLTDHWQLCF